MLESKRYLRARELVVAAFRERWRETIDGVREPEASDTFAAPLKKTRDQMARRFYAKSHLASLLSMSDRDIEKNLRPVIAYLAVQKESPLRRSLVSKLLSCQYVLFSADTDLAESLGPGYEIPFESDDFTGWSATGYPQLVLNDDWYERVGGFHSTFLGVLMKSSGERFSASERQHLARSVFENVKRNECDRLWSFAFHPHGHCQNQLAIAISDFSPEYRNALEFQVSSVPTLIEQDQLVGIFRLI